MHGPGNFAIARMLKSYNGSCHCGVRPFGVGNNTPVGRMYGVNIGCLEGIWEEELSKLTITCVDGLNDRWPQAPEFFSHL